jgi:hypothetical protein
MKHDYRTGWLLVIGSIFLLIAMGKLDLLVLLVPLSLLLGCALLWLGRTRTGLTSAIKKG